MLYNRFLLVIYFIYNSVCVCQSQFNPTFTLGLEKAMAPHSSTLAWKIPWTEEPGRLQSVGSQRVGHDWATSLSLSCLEWVIILIYSLILDWNRILASSLGTWLRAVMQIGLVLLQWEWLCVLPAEQGHCWWQCRVGAEFNSGSTLLHNIGDT